MKIFLLLSFAFLINSCASKDGVYWCGDHPCINKAEKEAYFKKTMIVDFRKIKNNNKEDQSKLDKILKEAKNNEKKRISNEKTLKKQTKLPIIIKGIMTNLNIAIYMTIIALFKP